MAIDLDDRVEGDTVDPKPETEHRSVLVTLGDVLSGWYTTALTWLLCDKRSLYGASFARILSGCAVLGLLTTNFRQRDLLFGPGSSWNRPMQADAKYWPPHLVADLGPGPFLLFYLAVMALAVCWILGWHARVVGPLMLIGNIAIIERIPVLGDQGDNILRVGLFILMFMYTTEHWSLDARRRARTERVEVVSHAGFGQNAAAVIRNAFNTHRMLPPWLSNGIHNVTVAMLAFQLTLIYISAGMFKTQGSLWQHGTALYYPLQLQEYKPFPFLTDLFTHFGLLIGVATYVVVFVQLYFPVMIVASVATRRIAIAIVLLFHLSIAVMMALPWFSLEMVAFDSIFVSGTTYIALSGWIKRKLSPVAALWLDLTDPIMNKVGGREPGGRRRAA